MSRDGRGWARWWGSGTALIALFTLGCRAGSGSDVEPSAGCTTNGTVTIEVRDVSLDAERGGGSFAGQVLEVAEAGASALRPGAEAIVVVRSAEPLTALTVDGHAATLAEVRAGNRALVAFSTRCGAVDPTEEPLIARSVSVQT